VAEGDTILRLAQRLEAALVGQELAVNAPNPRGRAAGVKRLDGLQLEAAEARGKHLLLHFGELVLHSHLGMSGGWHVYSLGAPWRRPRSSAWVVLAGRDQEAVQFGGPTMRLLTARQLRSDAQLSTLGPDILAADFDVEMAISSLRRDYTRGIGDALLDQRLLAGIGNIFKSEACFAARLDPWRPVGDLSDEELRAVLLAARGEMRDAVASGRKSFSIYRHRGPCRACGGSILSRGQGDANRTTYWCPHCQV